MSSRPQSKGVHLGRAWARTRWLVSLGCLALLASGLVSLQPARAQQLAPRLFSTAELITRLNSPRFQERDEATRELVSLGEEGLRPLAKGYLGSSPEQAWRIRQIIRQICIRGDEAVFFKAAAVLRLLFGDSLGTSEIESLRTEWMNAKSDRAIEELKSHGADVQIVSQLSDGMDDLLIVMNQAEVPGQSKEDKPKEAVESKVAVPREPEQVLAAIDGILVASISENRKAALGLSDEEVASAAATESDPEAALQREIAGMAQNRIVIAGRGRVMLNARGGYFYPEYADKVSFDSKWNGELKDFLNVVAVKGINSVELKDIELTSEHLQAVSRVGALQHIRIDGCRMDKATLEGLRELAGLGNLSLANLTITPDMEAVLAEFTSLQSLRLENITFQSGTFWKQFLNAPALFYLDLKSLTLSGDDLKEIGKLPALQSLILTWTKFPLGEYREFLAQHPTLRPQVVNKAFLGVRGGLTLVDQDQGPCVISEVIADSAAAKAGMQIDDVVTQVNDQKVETFRELIMYVSNFNPGETIKVRVLREGKPLDLDVTLVERPPNAQ